MITSRFSLKQLILFVIVAAIVLFALRYVIRSYAASAAIAAACVAALMLVLTSLMLYAALCAVDNLFNTDARDADAPPIVLEPSEPGSGPKSGP